MEPPKHYPSQAHHDSPQPPQHRAAGLTKVYPVEMTYEYLRQGCAYCFYNIFKGVWNVREAHTYLQVLGVKEDYRKQHVIQKAEALHKDRPAHSNCLLELHYPALWTSGSHLHQCIDTPMHQIFQGVIKAVIECAATWMKGLKIHTRLCEENIDYMRHIKALHLEWCKLEPFAVGAKGPSHGGWVAETYIAYVCQDHASTVYLHIR